MRRNSRNRKMVSFDIEGVVAPVFTPIKDNKLNLKLIPEYAEYLKKNKIGAILVGGTTGEVVTLSLEERKQLLQAWLEAAKPAGLKVIAQIGGVPMPEVLEMARFAEEHKADAIMTLPEIYYKPSCDAQLVVYLGVVSKHAPSLPLLYYHFPMMSGVQVKNMRAFFLAATKAIPNFKGMKADLDVAVQVTDLLEKDQRIFIGNHMIAPAVLLGHESSIATVTNIYPELVLDIVKATKEGRVAEVRTLQEKMNKLVRIITDEGDFQPSMKAAMALVSGIEVGHPRPPLDPLDAAHKRNMAEHLTALGIQLA